MILRGYAGAQNWAKVMDVADRWAGLPGANPTTKVNAFTAALEAAQQANNFQKIVEYGDKILAIDGSNLNAQLVLATLLPERLPNDEAGKQAALNKAEGLATKAISGLGSMAKPAGVSDPDWNGFKSSSLGQLHGSLGLIYLTRADYEKAEKAYEEALKSTPKDGVARYRLGLAIEYQMPEKSKAMVAAIDAENAARRANADKAIIDEHAAVGAGLADLVRQMRDKAIDQFAYAVAIGGAQAGPARVELEKLYKNKNEGSLQGLDELISKKKAEIGD
jgi:tetratricopeptide (TPR) repeat protein